MKSGHADLIRHLPQNIDIPVMADDSTPPLYNDYAARARGGLSPRLFPPQ
jgi:hypothetical protein